MGRFVLVRVLGAAGRIGHGSGRDKGREDGGQQPLRMSRSGTGRDHDVHIAKVVHGGEKFNYTAIIIDFGCGGLGENRPLLTLVLAHRILH